MKHILLILSSSIALLFSQTSRSSVVLDDGTDASQWRLFESAGVVVHHRNENGSIRFDITFTKGSGYGGIVKNFNQSLPENYEISFLIRATVPVNNLEIKVSSDSAGENIWWMNLKNYVFSPEWKRIVIKKRHLNFAWGLNPAPSPAKLSRMEIVVTAGTGGKGSVWIDDINLTTLPTTPATLPVPAIRASSYKNNESTPENILPGRKGVWISRSNKNEWIEIDLKYEKEFGALNVVWDTSMKNISYTILTSFDGKKYETVHSVMNGTTGNVTHFLPESDARFVRINLKKNAAAIPFVMKECSVIASESISTPNQYFDFIAQHSAPGLFPRYFLKQQQYWTVVGVPSDTREALLSEDGSVEVDRQKFSLEPFIVMTKGKKIYHWNNAVTDQYLENNYLPIPTVERKYQDALLRITLIATGDPERSAVMAQYVIKNISKEKQKGSFYLALRPFQVNPTSQWLNYDGGFAAVQSMNISGNRAVVDEKTVVVSGRPSDAGVSAIEQGDIINFIVNDTLPATPSASQAQGMMSGAFRYSFDLEPGDSTEIIAAVPFTESGNMWSDHLPNPSEYRIKHDETREYWLQKLNTVEFTVNAEAQHYIDVIRSNLAYILINKDKNGFQPGSRSYERSWIRDGSMTSDALLKLGISDDSKKFLEWYSGFQYENGAVPCVVDSRGPDPVPEHDSHGQLIFGCMEYFRFTHDTVFLRERWNTISSAVQYIQSLRALRLTPEFKDGDDKTRAYYGLVTESISHEGYSDKPMHSYWDNFFVLKGLKDAAAAALVLGKSTIAREYDSLAKAFRMDLYNSIALTMKNKNISYVPGCVEKGDFDATSTSIALFPAGEMDYVPEPAYRETFDKYYDWFIQRKKNEISWTAYTPYEIRNVGTFVYLNEKERAHTLLEYFMHDQRPKGWNHWAEVVANGYRTMRFIGDMPHTWVGSDYINAIRAMFVYENDDDQTVVLGAGLKDSWLKDGISVKNIPTHFGILTYTIVPAVSGEFRMDISGTVDAQKHPIVIPQSLQSNSIKKVIVNEAEIPRDSEYIRINKLPATIYFKY